MADPASRLRGPRRRPPNRTDPRGRSGAGDPLASGDLFEHFGVVRERDEPQLAAIVAAEPCPACGWLRALGELPGDPRGDTEAAGDRAPELDACRLCAAVIAPVNSTGCG